MKKLITIIVAAAGIMAASAETSTNSTTNGVAVAAVKYPWISSITAGLSLTRGNSSSELASLKFLSDKKTPVNEYSLDADGAYGSANGVQNNDSVHGFTQWNHLFSERLFGYMRLEGLHDDIASVRYRATYTAGMGCYFIKETQTTLAGEVGPGIVSERVGSTDNTFATLRLAERFEHKFTDNHARVWQSVEILPQVDKLSDFLVNAEVGAEAAVAKNLSLQVCLDDNYNTEPAAGFKRNDVKLVSGVSYKF
jgi:putative salt-induced outer membrane protein YdiY